MFPHSQEEYDKLEKSILGEHCRDKIAIWQFDEKEIIIDGMTRYQICHRHKCADGKPLPYELIVYDKNNFKNRDDVKIWILNNQLSRRNLTDAQRIEIALRLKEIIAKTKRAGRPKNNEVQNEPRLDTDQEIAKSADTSETKVKKFNVIKNSGNEALINKVLVDDMSINKGYEQIRHKNANTNSEGNICKPSLSEIKDLFNSIMGFTYQLQSIPTIPFDKIDMKLYQKLKHFRRDFQTLLESLNLLIPCDEGTGVCYANTGSSANKTLVESEGV